MSLPTYEEYRDSGVPWLGAVPLHWEVQRFKWLIERNDGGVWGDDPDGVDDTVVLRSTEQSVDGRWRIDDPAKRKLTEKDRLSALLEVGDLLLTKSSGSALHIGKTTLVDERVASIGACYSNFMQRLRVVDDFCPRLAWYILNNSLARVQLDLLSNSTTGLANLNGTIIGELLLALPPQKEQSAIADFLDRETAKIDTLIAEQEKLIALLAEKRQATISHAVTRGLNPDAPMKDSGVDWLGEVPAHWDVVQLRRVLKGFEQGWSPECEARQVDGDEWGVLKAGCLNGGVFQANEHKALPSALEPRVNFEVHDGDVLMSRASGSPKLIGSVALLVDPPPRLMLSDKIFRLRLSQDMSSSYFALVMGSRPLRIQIEQSIGGAEGLANNLSQASIKEFWLTVPPLDEQKAVASYLGSEAKKYDGLVQEVACGIELLKERRSALISAVVTGQIDVRGLADANSTV